MISYRLADDPLVEIIRIENDGTILWKGREVESDAEFRSAMIDLKNALVSNNFVQTNQ
jgi:hypothetical protein